MEIKIDTSELTSRLDSIESMLKKFTEEQEPAPLYAKTSYFAKMFNVSERFMTERLEEAKLHVHVLRYGRNLVLFNTRETIDWIEKSLATK